tara:strand:+ start:1564 stop:1695 length:132 start_codon:yes stop_codon:yes gene_type:complete
MVGCEDFRVTFLHEIAGKRAVEVSEDLILSNVTLALLRENLML